MPLDQRFFDTWKPRALAALRIVAAFLYLQHGTAKLLHMPHVTEFDSLAALSLVGFAGMLETAGSLLLLLGLFTRPVAFILSGRWRWRTSWRMHRKAISSAHRSTAGRRQSCTALSSCFCRLPAAAPGVLTRVAAADKRKPTYPSPKAPSGGSFGKAFEVHRSAAPAIGRIPGLDGLAGDNCATDLCDLKLHRAPPQEAHFSVPGRGGMDFERQPSEADYCSRPTRRSST